MMNEARLHSLQEPHLSPAGAPLSTLSAESTASADVSTRPTSSSALFTAEGVQCCVCRGGGVGFTGRAGFGGRAGLPTPCRLSCNPSGVPTGVEVLCGGDSSPLNSRRMPYNNRYNSVMLTDIFLSSSRVNSYICTLLIYRAYNEINL
jgi:hypothetical protein